MGKSGTKITILGAGNVGASVAYTMAVAGTCSDIVLVDITHIAHITAEKHDSFITPVPGGKVIMEFSGKELIQGEPELPLEDSLPRYARLKKVLANPAKYAPSGVYIMRIHGTFVNFLDLSPEIQQDIITRLDLKSTSIGC